jgi:hypothetical protein
MKLRLRQTRIQLPKPMEEQLPAEFAEFECTQKSLFRSHPLKHFQVHFACRIPALFHQK